MERQGVGDDVRVLRAVYAIAAMQGRMQYGLEYEDVCCSNETRLLMPTRNRNASCSPPQPQDAANILGHVNFERRPAWLMIHWGCADSHSSCACFAQVAP
jgi:hypothetical protein